MMSENPYPSNVSALPAGSGQIEVFQFFAGQDLVVHVTAMKESCWIYVGRHDQPMMDSLTLTMNGGADSSLMGSNEDGRRMALHIQKRFKLAACFVSFNGSPDQASDAEKTIMGELVGRKIDFSKK